MIRPVRSSRTGPVTLTPSSSRAPAFSACLARISSKSSRLRTRLYPGKLESSGQFSSIRPPPPMIRRPLLRTQPSLWPSGTPIPVSALTARGARPSPQTFSRGKWLFSRTSTSKPALAR